MLLNDAGSIPTVNIFITCLGVVNLMEKLFSRAQTSLPQADKCTKEFHKTTAQQPTHPPQKAADPPPPPVHAPKIGENQTNQTTPQ